VLLLDALDGDPFGRPGRVEGGGYTCPMLYLSLFDDAQVAQYLRRRFPDRIADRLLMRPNPRRSRAEQLVRPMCSLRFRPLLLAYVENIIGEEQDLLADTV
jgi:glutathione S-transferase